jgi:hypothetical protein
VTGTPSAPTSDGCPATAAAQPAGSLPREVQRRLERTVWNAGRCASWYLGENGGNPIMWSDFTFRFRWLARRFELEEHVVARRRQERGDGGERSRLTALSSAQ